MNDDLLDENLDLKILPSLINRVINAPRYYEQDKGIQSAVRSNFCKQSQKKQI